MALMMKILQDLLFNKILNRQIVAKPKLHGNSGTSTKAAQNLIERELAKLDGIDDEDLPRFALVLLSDRKPSDMLHLAKAD